MVTNIASGSSSHLLAQHTALERLRKPREKTEAETKLDEVLSAMKNDGAEAARQKLERIKAKLKMLQLAAGSAAASGDAKAARSVARQIQEAARELSDALRAAGGNGGGAGIAIPMTPTADANASAQQAAIKDMNADNPEHVAQLNGGTLAEGRKADAESRAVALLKIKDAETAFATAPQQAEEKDKAASAKSLDELKEEARKLLSEMRKILEQARLALLHPLARKKDAAGAQDDFRAADQALAGLNAATLGKAGSGIDLSV